MDITEKINKYLIKENFKNDFKNDFKKELKNLKRIGQYLKRIGKLILGYDLSIEEFLSISPGWMGGHFLSDEAIYYIQKLKKIKTKKQMNDLIKEIQSKIDNFTKTEINDFEIVLDYIEDELEKQKRLK